MRTFFGKQEPIKFKTSKVLPYSHEIFFKVVKDVQDYEKFIPWINSSKIIQDTIAQEEQYSKKPGKFEGEVKIGFSQLSFAYISRVSY
jgi:ribosome-associated toxin RatA of RatAB toxin-antitoxin module